MPDFQPIPDGGVRLSLDETETRVLRGITAELRALLGGTKEAKGDRVLERLFPAAYETAEDEASYREMTSDDLQRHKLEALDVVSTSLGRRKTSVEISGEDFDAWLASLTDLRLAIGTRLDVDEARMGAEIDPSDPDAEAMAILHWLGWVQEGLLQASGRA